MNFLKKRANVLALFAALALLGGQASSDWVASTPSGNVTIGSSVSGSTHFQKIVPTDPNGVQVGTSTSPISVSVVQGGNTAAVSAGGAVSINVTGLNGSIPSASNPVPTVSVVGSAVASASNPNPVQLSQGNAPVTSSNPVPSTIIVGGSPVSSSNALPISLTVAPPTYSIGNNQAPAANSQDVVSIQGSASKTIKITGASIAVNASCGSVWAAIVRRSSANTGGSNLTTSVMKHDSLDGSPVATLFYYTSGAPITGIGTLVGYLRSGNSINQGLAYKFGVNNDKPIYVRGTSDWVSISLLGSNPGGCTIFPWIEWTEE